MIKVKIYYQKLKLIVYELNSVRLRILGYGNKLELIWQHIIILNKS